MRFGIRSASVENVGDVSTKLVTSRRVIFVPNSDIKQELAKTSISITCIDRNGKVVKQITSNDDGTVDDGDDTNDGGSDSGTSTGDSGATA